MASTETSTPITLDARTLAERLAAGNGPRVLDVRTPAEFESVHIPGAYNVPLDTLKEHRDEIRGHLDTDVVLVCRSGQRASQAEQALAAAGLPNVHVLEGGMLAWERSGGAVNRGREKWDLERQVRLVAGSLVLAGVVGSIAVPGLKWVSAFVGGGLTFAALSNTCAMGTLLSKLPYNRGAACDPRAMVAQLAASQPDRQQAPRA
jgi:rhodanese-related sulfurtransferase